MDSSGLIGGGAATPLPQMTVQAQQVPQEQQKQMMMPQQQAQMMPQYQQPWMTQEDCCKDGCGTYTACQSADDQTMIAQHVGLPETTDCVSVVLQRSCGLCGGICMVGSKAQRYKTAYSQRYNLVPQPVSPSAQL